MQLVIETSFAIFPDFGEKLKMALHCPKPCSPLHLLLSLLSLPKHSFLRIGAVLAVTSSFFLLGADISDHVPVLDWGMGRYRLQFRFIEEHKFPPPLAKKASSSINHLTGGHYNNNLVLTEWSQELL